MKTIIDSNTGKVLYSTSIETELQENEIEIEALLTERFVNPYWDFDTQTFFEQATQTEINDVRIPQALEIDLYYTGLISELLRKHIEKLSIDGIAIPQSAIDERDRLRAECNEKIMELGITDFTYRQQNIRL
jgi:hypothetical protein